MIIGDRDPTHPRPLLQRASWTSLDGTWSFGTAPRDLDPGDVVLDTTIQVPFSPGTPASTVAGAPPSSCWYRRSIDVPELAPGDRLLLHVGAADRHARVWADRRLVGEHVGAWTPFTADLTAAALDSGTSQIEVTIHVQDAPTSMSIPRGKQDWQPEPHLIWYPPTSGIWQTVWLEVVPAVRIGGLRWSSDLASASVEVIVDIEGSVAIGDRVQVVLSFRDRILVDDTIEVREVVDGRARLRRRFPLGVAGVDDPMELTWRPSRPSLIEAELTLTSSAGPDRVRSYTALRSVGVEAGRFVLNGHPYRLRLALDQGYWDESGLTAPSVDALRRDVELVRELGLNGVRKHQKVEDPRWLAQCDELGVLVWEELPSAYAFDDDLASTLASEWSGVVRRDRNHPCIVAWVPVNESWGVPNVAADPQQAELVRALAALTRSLDPTRPVSANDGWETVDGQIVGIHDYDQDPDSLRGRYATAASIDALFDAFGPGRRRLTADGSGREGRALVLSEFGGTTFSDDASKLFGYGNTTDVDSFIGRVRALCAAALASEELSGYCWTQLTDTYQEANGLVRMDRSAKAPMADLRAALRGEGVRPERGEP